MGGLVVDLGLSSDQLDDPARGFSFQSEGPLDMRFDRSSGDPTAADLVRELPEHELEKVLRDLGDEPHARRIARAIVLARAEAAVTTTRQLADVVARATPPPRGRDRHAGPRTHPATRTFQGLRIAVNRELEGLDVFVREAAMSLAPAGRMAAISFHGGEDVIVKNALRDLGGRCTCPPELPRCACGRVATVTVMTKKPIWASDEETRRNPRARSARMRVAQRLAPAH